MARNVTVQVGDELAGKMEKLPDVNWSEVVRGCLERYCNLRLDADVEALAQKMKDQKEESYTEGYKAALEWFKEEGVRYEHVSEIFQAFDRFESEWDSKVEEEFGDWEKAMEDSPGINEHYMRDEREFWRERVNKIVEASYQVTQAFVDGFKAALEKLVKVGEREWKLQP